MKDEFYMEEDDKNTRERMKKEDQMLKDQFDKYMADKRKKE